MSLPIPRFAYISAAITLLGCLSLAPASAALIDRGNGLIYDTDLDLTWLANANAGAGSAFDDGTNTTDGGMSWASAIAWADSLTVGGATDWRLPATLDPDPTCTDAPAPRGFGCSSEMGHLFYGELGGAANHTIFDSTDPDLALFSNIQANPYWSGTTEAGFPDYAWDFSFTLGSQSDAFKTTNFLPAWAVHDGDIAAVPAPAAGWLLGTGLLGVLAGARRRRDKLRG